ncbi:MAG TPA: LptF/LptG family permease [Saprospiraceae bacterium]|nr:LptF/LptG family permease [Saprospiraceae bacterium]MCB9327338.1 LptF/LptG family permease [Lewinellaceae bacterium]HPQ20295.1 LptF/LptG family permease [Saprospiraceae bacterium]
MLKILDRYIIKKYISTFFFTMVLITMIAITIDFFEKVDKFLSDEMTAKEIVFDYYLNFIPWINGLLWPLFALLAVIFFTSRMAKNSEIIAILASGVSYRRFLLPFIAAGGFIAVLLWLGNNYVIPNSNKIKTEFESKYIRKSIIQTLSGNIHFFLNPNEKVYIRNYNSRDSVVRGFRLEKFQNGQLTSILKAQQLKFVEAPNLWKMKGIERRSIDGLKESLMFEPKEEIDTSLNFVPEDFVRYSRQMEMMTTDDLKEFIKIEQDKGLETSKSLIIELYRRTADPFTILIVTIMGVCIGSRKVRGGMGFHLAAGVVLGAIFVILSKFSTTFSSNLSLPPAIGVWIPNIVFGFIAILLYKGAQK